MTEAAPVPVLKEKERGCGYRKPGGIYLVCDPVGLVDCCSLPVRAESCPTCGAGIKPSRGFAWVDPRPLFEDSPRCELPCSVAQLRLEGLERCGLIWVGKSFYPTTHAFLEEARTQGVSRRVNALPRGLEAGKTPVLLAHRETVFPPGEPQLVGPGIFSCFVPSRFEQVLRPEEYGDTDFHQKLRARGIDPVIVEEAR